VRERERGSSIYRVENKKRRIKRNSLTKREKNSSFSSQLSTSTTPASAAEVVITPPKVFPPNFVDPTTKWHVNERIIFRPAGYAIFKRLENLVNTTGKYPFVYGPPFLPGALKNSTTTKNATVVRAVGVIGTGVNATATALNFTSPVAGLGSDLAQAANNAIKVRNKRRTRERKKELGARERKKKRKNALDLDLDLSLSLSLSLPKPPQKRLITDHQRRLQPDRRQGRQCDRLQGEFRGL